MGLSVVFVSGPRFAGKSALIRVMIDQLWATEPHYIRLVQADGDKRRPEPSLHQPKSCGVASARWLEYEREHVFEILPEALAAIHKRDRYGSVVIEADADPSMRCAYPYDHRIFVMPVPSGVAEVFRDQTQGAEELQRVLDDTAAFASEIFGLLTQDKQVDCDPSEDRVDFTATQMRSFLYSPLGDELATRIQLQQPYHGLVESDVIVVNKRVSRVGPGTNECLRRIERLLERMRAVSGRQGVLFLCDSLEYQNGKINGKLFKTLKPMCTGGS